MTNRLHFLEQMSFLTTTKKEAEAGTFIIDKANQGTVYGPDRKGYAPLNEAFWKAGERVPYLGLAQKFQIIVEISGRLQMIDILSNYFGLVILISPCDLLAIVLKSLNRLVPVERRVGNCGTFTE